MKELELGVESIVREKEQTKARLEMFEEAETVGWTKRVAEMERELEECREVMQMMEEREERHDEEEEEEGKKTEKEEKKTERLERRLREAEEELEKAQEEAEETIRLAEGRQTYEWFTVEQICKNTVGKVFESNDDVLLTEKWKMNTRLDWKRR